MSNEQIHAILRENEDLGTYACLCPECDDGRPVLGVRTLGHTPCVQFQPCPRHPNGDWEFPAEDLYLLDWGDEDDESE